MPLASKYPTVQAIIAATPNTLPSRIQRRRTFLFGGVGCRCGRGTRGIDGAVSKRAMPGGRCGIARCLFVPLSAARRCDAVLSQESPCGPGRPSILVLLVSRKLWLCILSLPGREQGGLCARERINNAMCQ